MSFRCKDGTRLYIYIEEVYDGGDETSLDCFVG